MYDDDTDDNDYYDEDDKDDKDKSDITGVTVSSWCKIFQAWRLNFLKLIP